jgi:two-component system LytT family response regulator
MKIKCLAIDDEPYALKQIADYILKTPFLELSGKCSNAFEAMEHMASNEVDIIYVDVSMPEMNGLDFVKTLPAGTGAIFTTAYSQFAVESYKLDAIDYLLKPISYDDFLRAANKGKEWVRLIQQKNSDVKSNKNFLFIKSEYKTIRINFNEIRYIQGMSEYVQIHLINSKPIMSLLSLKSLEAQLPDNMFMRVHRSFIVNLQKINIIERNEIIYDDGVIIPVSQQYLSNFQDFVDKNFIL